MNILSQLKYGKNTQDLDSLTYQDHITEYPVPDIVNFEWKKVLPHPASNSSKQTYNELLEVYNKSSRRSKNDLEMVRKIDQNPNFFLYDLLDRLNISFAYETFEEMYSILKPILKNTKNIFNRARPYQLAKFYDLEINVDITDTHHTPSYPSGHTLYTKLAANIVMDQYPNLKNELNKIVNMTAEARIIQGVHYRSDSHASIVLTDYLYKNIKKQLYGV